jgi:hypothetical protein
METPNGPTVLGDVILSMALWLEVEEVWLDDARKVEYTLPEGTALQRVEFHFTTDRVSGLARVPPDVKG